MNNNPCNTNEINAPCFHCPKRTITCDCCCAKYKAYKEHIERIRKRKREKAEEREFELKYK